MFKDSKMELPQEKITDYQQNGFVQIENVLSEEETAELGIYVDEVMNNSQQKAVQTSAVGGVYYKVLNQRVNTWRDHGGMARFVLSERLASPGKSTHWKYRGLVIS